jgi:hypothetical protein
MVTRHDSLNLMGLQLCCFAHGLTQPLGEKMQEHLLSFVTDQDGNQVFIHADKAGLEYLIQELTRLKKGIEDNDCPHSHFFSAEWGGDSLSLSKLEDLPDEVNQVHHVKIYGWTEEWREKHKLSMFDSNSRCSGSDRLRR